MPNLSANTLFHFTPKKWLLSILEKGFLPRYSPEFTPEVDMGYFNSIVHAAESTINAKGERVDKDLTGIDPVTMYIPMVCFCDIPFSSLLKHMDTYASFGIGLTKEWGIQRGLNPVMYVNDKSAFFKNAAGRLNFLSFLFEILQDPYNKIKSGFPDIHTNEEFRRILQTNSSQQSIFYGLYLSIKTHMKPYESKGDYRGHPAPYRYYDEKEWRYVPFIAGEEAPQPLIEKNISDEEKDDLNSKMEQYPVTFNPNDIKYILVEKESDIEYVVGGLNDIRHKTGKYSEQEIHKITTKIITRTQIEEDF